MYAEHSLNLGTHDVVLAGDLGVAISAPTPDGPQLVLGGYDIDVHGNLLSPSTQLGPNTNVGDVQTDSLINQGSHTGVVSTFPYALMPNLPLAPAGAPTGTTITVAAGQRVLIGPGSYGHVTVNGTLFLAAGTYAMSSITVGSCGRFYADHGGVEVRVASSLTTSAAAACPAVIAPVNEGQCNGQGNCAVTGASGLLIRVAGDNPAGGSSVSLGAGTSLRALLAAPHGTIAIGDNVGVDGALAAFDISAGQHVQFNLDGGFAAGAAGESGSQALSGYFGVQPTGSYPVLGPVPASTQVAISVGLPVTDPGGLSTFIHAVSDPADPMYRQYLTVDQFNQRFGASAADYSALQQWATNAGLTITHTFSNNLLLSVSGTAIQVENALHTNLIYRRSGDGVTSFVAVDREPSVDLAPQVLSIGGLTSYRPPQNASCVSVPSFQTTWSAVNLGALPAQFNYFMAEDLRVAYLGRSPSPCAALTGQGQTVGILAFQDYNGSDISGYICDQKHNSLWPLPTGTLTRINVNDPWVSDADSTETAMDIEMVMAMAPGASIKVFVGGSALNFHADDVLAAMATDPTLTVASSSWFWYGNPLVQSNPQQSLAQMAAQGVSFFTASGDNGNVGDPTSSLDFDYQTLVGGSSLQGSIAGVTGDTNANCTATGTPFYCSGSSNPNCYWLNDATWNNHCSGLISGGGIMDRVGNLASGCFVGCSASGAPSIPDYQAALLRSNPYGTSNGASNSFRNYPDVAMPADLLAIHWQGSPTLGVGTSAAAPLWAGYTALVNQYAANQGAKQLGFANPSLYGVGATSLYTSVFHDIADQVDNNSIDFVSPETLRSVPGYDLVTGLGTPTCALIQQLGTYNPTTPQTYTTLLVHLFNGHDGVDDDSQVYLDVFANDEGGSEIINQEIKIGHETGWDGGTDHIYKVFLPVALAPNDIGELKLHLTGSDDDWDIAGFQALLANEVNNGVDACVIDLSGGHFEPPDGHPTNQCDIQQPNCSTSGLLTDGHTGVMRLGDSKPDAFFDVSPTFGDLSTGCTQWGGTVTVNSFDRLEFIIDTGDDDLDSLTRLIANVRDANSQALVTEQLHPVAAATFDDQSEWRITVDLTGLNSLTGHVSLSQINSIDFTVNNDSILAQDWHIQAITVYGVDSRSDWVRTCIARFQLPLDLSSAFPNTYSVPANVGCE